MNICLVCGETGAGKSTFTRMMSNEGYAVFHSGAVFNRISKMSDIEKTDDMESPKFADSEIRASMYRFLRTFSNEDSVFIETVPRSIDSLEWVKELVSREGDEVFALWFHLDSEMRKQRMIDRDSGRTEFDMQRFEREDKQKHKELIYGLTTSLKTGHFLMIDGSRPIDEIFRTVDYAIDLSGGNRRLTIHRNYNSAVNGYFERSGYHCEQAVFERMIERIRGELDELEEEYNKADRSKEAVEMEFADVTHFYFCLANACGIGWEDIVRTFQKKTQINQARLQFNITDHRKHLLNGNLVGEIYSKAEGEDNGN